VKKPIIETIKKKDGTSMNVMKQTTVITSIETTPIEKKKSSNSNLVKECITNIYTTLTKAIDESNEKILIRNKSYDNIKLSNNIKKNGNKKVFIKRKIMDDNYNNKKSKLNNFPQPDDNQKETKFDINQNNNNNLKKDNYIDISEISNNLLKNETINSSIDNSSLMSYEEIEPNNNTIRIKEEIKYIKYLYYRCTLLNSENKAKSESLSNYFLKKTDEEKIGILTYLNNGEQENIKIYQKLINILKEKRKKEENSMKISKNAFDENIISDFTESKGTKNKKTNILFKKKKIIK
jgi:hypothetical protein